MGDYGFKVSLPGVDVKTASNKNLVISSSFACLKVVSSGKQNFTINSGSSQNFTIPLPFSPPLMTFIFLYNPADGFWKPAEQDSIPDSWSDYYWAVYSFDNYNLYITISNNTGSSINSYFIYLIGYP
jgi:hypothetical protein